MITGASRCRGGDSNNRSLARTGHQIGDYAETVVKTRIFAIERNHEQPCDPAKLGQTLLELAKRSESAAALSLRTDALERIEEKNLFVERETAQ